MPHQESLRCEHVFYLACADAKSECTHAAVCRGMAVAAHKRRAGKGKALLGSNDVNNALLSGSRTEIAHAEFGCIALEGSELLRTFRVADRNGMALGIYTLGGR